MNFQSPACICKRKTQKSKWSAQHSVAQSHLFCYNICLFSLQFVVANTKYLCKVDVYIQLRNYSTPDFVLNNFPPTGQNLSTIYITLWFILYEIISKNVNKMTSNMLTITNLYFQTYELMYKLANPSQVVPNSGQPHRNLFGLTGSGVILWNYNSKFVLTTAQNVIVRCFVAYWTTADLISWFTHN